METKKIKLLGGVAVVTTAIALATAVATTTKLINVAKASVGYTCASIHFGMRDSDMTAMTYAGSTTVSNFNSHCTVSGVTVASCTLTNVYHGGNYTNADTNYNEYCWKLGGSKKKPVMEITFNENIIGITLYALAFGSDPVEVQVQGQNYTLTQSGDDLTKANAEVMTYEKVPFTFESTKTITITTKNASKTVDGKSVSACRFYLADISFRVAN